MQFLETNNAFAACLQETWKLGNTIEQHNSNIIINHGPDKKLCHRGSLGVVIVITRHSKQAWEQAGSQQLYFGNRIIATRFHMDGANGKTIKLFLVSAYAPIGSSKPDVHAIYSDQLQRCIDSCKKDEILIIGTDANASCGTRNKKDDPYSPDRDQVRGPWGNPYQNKAGANFTSFLGTNELCLPSTYFRHKQYNTWTNPCSKLGHAIDQFVLRQSNRKHVLDCGRYGKMAKDSDHHPIRIRILLERLKHKKPPPKTFRIDRDLLKDPEIRQNFIDEVKSSVLEQKHDGTSKVYKLEAGMRAAADAFLQSRKKKQPNWFKALEHKLQPAIKARNTAMAKYNLTLSAQSRQALQRARMKVKQLVSEAKLKWLDDKVKKLNSNNKHDPKAIWDAIVAIRNGMPVTKKITPMTLKKPDGSLCKTPEENAKIMEENLNTIFNKKGTYDPKVIDTVRQRDPALWKWMDTLPTDKEIAQAIKKLGDSKSGAEAKCPAEYFKAIIDDPEGYLLLREIINEYWTSGSYPDPNDIPIPPQNFDDPAANANIDIYAAAAAPRANEPDYSAHSDSTGGVFGKRSALFRIRLAKERKYAISFDQNSPKVNVRLKNAYKKYSSASTVEEALARGSYIEWLAEDLEAGHLTIEENFTLPPTEPGADADGIIYDEWLQARMKLLPKKGDLSLCKNWRAICLLDIASKIVSSILSNRMMMVMEATGLETQAGFRRLRGTIDGLFSTKIGLQKRQEHGLDTWALFIDLVKAFDTVIREATFAVLRKFGMPDHFVNLVVRLHTDAKMKFEIGDIDTAVPSDIGVRQGAIEGPILFLFFFQAALETAVWPVKKPTFYTRENGVTSGETWSRKTEKENHRNVKAFELWASLFADDCALLFDSREDLIIGAEYIFQHLRRFGLQMHVGRGAQASKTEAMYFPARPQDYKDGNTTDFGIDKDGFISFTEQFKYLGSYIHFSLQDTFDVTERIKSASKAFGALQSDIFANKHVSKKVKGKVFNTLVLTILLYGSECWTMTARIMRQLCTFYHRCIRKMSRITMHHTIKHHIKTTDLLQQLHLQPLHIYYETRLLRWAGHVSRMAMDRLPRKLLTGWVPHPRHNGGQMKTWGETLKDTLHSHHINTKFTTWKVLAENRPLWKSKTDFKRLKNND